MRFKREEITVISEETNFEGNLETSGSLTILGSLEGNIKSKTLVVAKVGKALGSVEATDITIAGYFDGELICHNLLTVAKGATVKGRIAYGTLEVESGGILEAEIFQLESVDTKLVPFHSPKVDTEER